jgi:hypothetical protein
MAAITSVPCPVCGRALQRRGNRKCRKCNLTVIEFGVELRVERLTDRRRMQLYGTEVVRLGQWVPEGKQLFGFSDGKWFLTTSWPNLDRDRLQEKRVRLEDRVYKGWVDRERLGPRIGWLMGFTFGKTSHCGIRARMPKACSCIPEGKYAATLVRKDDYVYLVFRVGPASSVQTT